MLLPRRAISRTQDQVQVLIAIPIHRMRGAEGPCVDCKERARFSSPRHKPRAVCAALQVVQGTVDSAHEELTVIKSQKNLKVDDPAQRV